MTDWLELAERCEKATGPSRELDAKIAEALGRPVSHDPWWNWRPGPRFDPPGDEWCIRRDGRNDTPCNEALPPFSFSLDAITALKERALPEWSWSSGYRARIGRFVGMAEIPEKMLVTTTAATEPLARCATLCRAMHEKEKA